jgi:plastocyanin
MTHPAVRFALASVALLLIWTDPPSARPETNLRLDVGTVAGTITVAPVSRPPAVVDYIARSVRRPPATTQSELRNVVLYVDGAPPPTVLPTETVAIRQIAETFEPRVLAVTRGSTVEFPNDDPFFHNVVSLSRAASFDLGRYERGTSRSRTLHEAGFVKVFCDLHS